MRGRESGSYSAAAVARYMYTLYVSQRISRERERERSERRGRLLAWEVRLYVYVARIPRVEFSNVNVTVKYTACALHLRGCAFVVG